MPQDNLSIYLASRPKDAIIPGETFKRKTSPAPTPADLKDGQILVEVLYLSLDPAMRGWLNGEHQHGFLSTLDVIYTY
jgi:NADPH-dependent curcumin reductase CurA